MSRENTIHDFDDHGLRWDVCASKFSYKGSILGVFSHGEFYSKSSVTAVKLSVRKDWVIIPYRKTLGHEEHERVTVEHLFFLYRKNENSVSWTCGWEKVHEGW